MARKSWELSFAKQYASEILELLRDPRNRQNLQIARIISEKYNLASKTEQTLSRFVQHLRNQQEVLYESGIDFVQEIEKYNERPGFRPDFKEDSLKIETDPAEIKPVEDVKYFGAKVGRSYPVFTKKELFMSHEQAEIMNSSDVFRIWLLIYDAHVPAHNQVLMGKILHILGNNRFDGLFFGGDFLDLASLSRYNAGSLKAMKDVTLVDEYKAGRKIIYDFEKAISGRPMEKVFLYGNHEARFFSELEKGDQSKLEGCLTTPEEALTLQRLNYKVLIDWKEDGYRIGKYLDLYHGAYYNVHVAKKMLETVEYSIIFGHTHRIQSFGSGQNMAWNIGGIFDIDHPLFRYAPRVQRKSWSNGFGIVYEMADGTFHFDQIPCFDDRFIFNGKLY